MFSLMVVLHRAAAGGCRGCVGTPTAWDCDMKLYMFDLDGTLADARAGL